MPEIRYKVLKNNLVSPCRSYQFNPDRWYHESNIGKPGNNDCQIGLYAGPIEFLLYRGVHHKSESAFRCEVKGKQAGESPLKECWESLRIIEKLTEAQVRNLAKRSHKRLGFLLEECLYPINPFLIERGPPTEAEIELLRDWILVQKSVRDSVWTSVWYSVGGLILDSVLDSVWYSIRDSIGDSIWDSVGNSAGDSVYAYIGSLFPSIKEWKYVEHEPGVYPFQAGATLWRAGLVPSYDGEIWRLHSGKGSGVVWEDKLK